MTLSDGWSGAALVGLGLWHGINPGMGWLFAVALGMQERRERAVWAALPPLAAGHAVAVGAAVAFALLAGRALDRELVRWVVAAVLGSVGVWRLARGRHPRWVGMRVNGRELATWSLLMATAHGAGLMVMPLVLGPEAAPAGHVHEAMHAATGLGGAEGTGGAWATLLHTAGYLLATAGLALVVYRKVGLLVLRRVWINLDLVWGAALIATGVATPFL